MIDSHQIVNVEGYDPELLYINPTIVHYNISTRSDGWQDKVPTELVEIIEKKNLFRGSEADKTTDGL